MGENLQTTAAISTAPHALSEIAKLGDSSAAEAAALGSASRFLLRDFASEAVGLFGAESADHTTATSSPVAVEDLDVLIELGRTHIALGDVEKLYPGSVVPLDERVADPVAIRVNGRLIARGEALVLDDQIAIRVTQLIAD